jgi:hypothetical protein
MYFLACAIDLRDLLTMLAANPPTVAGSCGPAADMAHFVLLMDFTVVSMPPEPLHTILRRQNVKKLAFLCLFDANVLSVILLMGVFACCSPCAIETGLCHRDEIRPASC